MKLKVFSISAIIIGIGVLISISFPIKKINMNIDWIDELNYKENQVHNMSIGFFIPCPSIPVKIGDKEVKLGFDTGNSNSIFLTTAIAEKVEYDVTGKSTQYNSDGTYRGDSLSILLKNITIFGEEYSNINSTISDWKMYSDFKFNGTVGLKFFNKKIITLDYKNKKIAISDNSIDYNKLEKDNYIILPLIKSNASNEGDLIFFEGDVNGKKSTIYLDTGSSHSFVNLEDNNKTTVTEVTLGGELFEFKRIRKSEIEFSGSFEYPLRLAINSDILKSNNFVITIDKIQNNLIIHQH